MLSLPAESEPLSLLLPLDITSPDIAPLVAQARNAAGNWVVPALSRFERVFLLRSPTAPGLAFVGAQASVTPTGAEMAPLRVNAGGTGLAIDTALVSCLGEGLEFISQVERESDVRITETFDRARSRLDPELATWLLDCYPALGNAASPPLDWCVAASVGSGEESLVPADLCLRRDGRRRVIQPLAPLSNGCAVGATPHEAATHAILELVERDAVSQWWQGGRRARPVALDGPVAGPATALLGRLRTGVRGRSSWLLDITTDLAIPVFAAVSVDDDGRRLACGFAAGMRAGDAANAALLEMTQVEMAFALIEAKRQEGGDAALDEVDRRHLARGAFDAAASPLLHATGAPIADSMATGQPGDAMADLLGRLDRHGVRLWLTDLSRPDDGIAAVRAWAPALQPFPSTYRTQRLRSVVANWGGGVHYAQGIDVM